MNCTKRTLDGDIVCVPLCASFVFTIVERFSLDRCCFFNVLPEYSFMKIPRESRKFFFE